MSDSERRTLQGLSFLLDNEESCAGRTVTEARSRLCADLKPHVCVPRSEPSRGQNERREVCGSQEALLTSRVYLQGLLTEAAALFSLKIKLSPQSPP